MGRRRSESSSASVSSHGAYQHSPSPPPRKERRGYRESRSRSHGRRPPQYTPPPRYNNRRGGGGGGGGYESPEHRDRRGRRAENPQPSKCIGVFGLSIYTDENTVRDIFSKFGPIKRIAMIFCPQVSVATPVFV